MHPSSYRNKRMHSQANIKSEINNFKYNDSNITLSQDKLARIGTKKLATIVGIIPT